jgi:hypothetical protein
MSLFGIDPGEIENAVMSIFGKGNDSQAGSVPQSGGAGSGAGAYMAAIHQSRPARNTLQSTRSLGIKQWAHSTQN